MAHLGEVAAGVPTGRVVAAPDVPACQTEPKMHPSPAAGQALLTAVGGAGRDGLTGGRDMFTHITHRGSLGPVPSRQVSLHLAGGADMGLGCVLTRLRLGAALPQQVPALVQFALQGREPLVLRPGVDLTGGQQLP
jgi:hypothetical protein